MVRTEKAGSQAEKMAAAAMDELNLDDLFGDGGDDLLKDCEMDMINVVGAGDTSASMEFESLKTEVIEAGDKSFTAATTTTTKSKRIKRKGSSNKSKNKNKNSSSSSTTTSSTTTSITESILQNTSHHQSLVQKSNSTSLDVTMTTSTKKESSMEVTTSSITALESSSTSLKRPGSSQRRDSSGKKQKSMDSTITATPSSTITNTTSTTSSNVGRRIPHQLPTRHGVILTPGASTILKTRKLPRQSTSSSSNSNQNKPLLYSNSVGTTDSIFSSSSNSIKSVKHSSSKPVQNKSKDHYYGLEPSSTAFFPYISLPKEVSMRRSHKMFPLLDKLYQSITLLKETSNNKKMSSSQPQDDILKQQHQLQKLMTSASAGNDTTSNASTKANIPKPSDVISSFSKEHLHSELTNVLYLLNRQTNFMHQSLENMKNWCQDNLSNEEYQSLYPRKHLHPPQSRPPTNNSTSIMMIPKLIKVKIKFTGYTQNQNKPSTLYAQMLGPVEIPSSKSFMMDNMTVHTQKKLISSSTTIPQQQQLPLDSSMKLSTTTTSKKKRESSTKKQQLVLPLDTPSSSTILTKGGSAKHQNTSKQTNKKKDDIMDSYMYHWNEKERYDFIYKNIIAQQKKELVKEIYNIDEKRHKALIKRETERQCILKETDDLLMCNTFTLWKIINNTTNYMSDIHPSDIYHELSTLWQPELPYREMHYNEFPTALIVTKSKQKIDGPETKSNNVYNPTTSKTEESEPKTILEKEERDEKCCVSTLSLFDRLQSLLVDENDYSDTNDDNEENDTIKQKTENRTLQTSILATNDNDNSLLTRHHQQQMSEYVTDISSDEEEMDVSELSLDQRAFIHLRAINLIDRPLVPSSVPVVIEDDIDEQVEVNELDIVIRAMQMDLSQQNCENNQSIAFLQASANAHLQTQFDGPKKKEQDAALSKHAQILKKQKESKKAAKKSKQSVADQDWIPW